MSPIDSAPGVTEPTPEFVPQTVEDVERALGLPVGHLERGMDGSCHYNDTPDCDPAQDCMAASAWHVRTKDGAMFQPCEAHMGRFLANYGVILWEQHEFGPTCSTEDSWWVTGGTEMNASESLCVLTEVGVRLGLLELVGD